MPVLWPFFRLSMLCLFAFLFVFSPSFAVAQSEDFVNGLASPDVSDLSTIASDSNEVVIEDGDFFDSEDLVPQGSMARASPVKVDPVTQPGSRYIIVRKNYSASTKEARLVSAERAASLGRYESAVIMFDKLYGGGTKNVRVLMGRAVVLQNLGRFDEAMQMYEALSKVEPDNIDAKVNMYGLLGTRYPELALRHLLDLHRDNVSNPALTAQIAVAYAQTGDVPSALKYLGIAASIEPENANHVFNMAIVSDRAGKAKQAVKYYEKALEIDTIHGAGRSIPRDSVYERLAKIR